MLFLGTVTFISVNIRSPAAPIPYRGADNHVLFYTMKLSTHFTALAGLLMLATATPTAPVQAQNGPAPVVTSFTPTSGPPGTRVRIRGRNLINRWGKVFFNGTGSLDVGFSGDTALTAIVPPGATTGKILVSTPDGNGESAANFVVTARLALITGFVPDHGRINDTITIRGKYLTGYKAVRFNGAKALYTILLNDSTLRARIPSGSTTGPVQVTGLLNTATSPSNFMVDGPPQILSATPNAGAVGRRIRLRGTGLANPLSVQFGAVAASQFASSGDTLLTVIVPAGTPTSSRIRVTTGNGSGQTVAFFTLTAPLAEITRVEPSAARLLDTVRIYGYNLTGFSAVRFNGALALYATLLTDTSIKAVIPVGSTTGKVTIQGAGNQAISPTDLLIAPAPQILAFQPGIGPVGAKIRIKGRGFTGLSEVRFGTVVAPQTWLSGDTLITAIVPPGAVQARVTVTAGGVSAVSVPFFVVTANPFLNVASFGPGSGPVGTEITLNGIYFTGARFVRFNGMNAAFTVVSDTVLTATVPAGASSGKISVVGLYNTFTTAGSFNVTATSMSDRIGLNEETTEELVDVYPNPSVNQMNIRFTEADDAQVYQLTAYALDGRPVFQKTLNGAELETGVRVEYNLNGGVYVLSLTGQDGSNRRIRFTVDR